LVGKHQRGFLRTRREPFGDVGNGRRGCAGARLLRAIGSEGPRFMARHSVMCETPSFSRMLIGLLREVNASSDSRTDLAREEARERGFQLLTRYLSPLQLAQYQTCGYFEVIGGDTGKRFRIRRGDQMNIEELDGNGHCAYALCFLPEGRLPIGDTMLAQKIALELYESDAIRVAHRCSARIDVMMEDMLFLRRRARR
jgi:hypothetical protein